MISDMGRTTMIGEGGNEGSYDDEIEKEIELLLREQKRQEGDERERELNIYRSGSAPPTMDGSLSAVGGLFGNSPFSDFVMSKNGNGVVSEEKLRSDPAYLSYYYSNVYLNPRLPPPLLSKEDWRFTQRLNKTDTDVYRRSLFATPPCFNSKKEEREMDSDKGLSSADWSKGGLIGLQGIGLGSKQKSFAEMFQDDLKSSNPNSRHPSHPASRNAFDEKADPLGNVEAELANLRQGSKLNNASYSLSRSTTPDPQHVAWVPSPCPIPIGEGRPEKRSITSQNSFNGVSFGMKENVDLVAALSGMKLSTNSTIDELSYRSVVGGPELRNLQVEPLKASFNRANVPTNNGGLSPHYGANSSFSNYGLDGYPMNPPLSPVMASHLSSLNLPPLLENVAASSLGFGIDSRPSDSQNLSRMNLHGNFVDPMYLQYLKAAEYAAQLGSLISPKKSQFGTTMGNNKSSGSNHGYYGNHSFGIGMGYHGIPNSPGGRGSPIGHNEFNMCYPSRVQNLGGMGPWPMNGSFGSSLLEEFKSNKTKSIELAEIAGHVVEFSADQYGSRFIQQKLETATIEEKAMVFHEINPHALTLTTDVFGNYVIQKFFEHGMPAQRRELAAKLDGHVLTLSLQMYGCRVIQKAIEVVDLDQKIKMVIELDGHIMRCVHDQNGNHVIQKCIECVPEESIQFIIDSFFNKVVTLSTHPYGCRVIQRVLEHCMDPDTQSKVMDEILLSVSMLAQNQYGNYVVQHVLEHGNPHERSIIIKELAGKIVEMSQQKFASNVIEKCLAFGGPEEREFMVNEMLGTTDENEPLQAMMKDQFANYVVQKVLETCSDQQRELIMSRIKVHLNALKKYTYGKHIVARVEKLLAAGERRAEMSQNNALLKQ